jgi:serine/threonine-protein kinase
MASVITGDSWDGPPLGARFADRYDLESVLGRGGMGAVYKAYDREVRDWVALKTLLTSLANLPAIEERFRREVRLARRITHKNVARIHDLGTHEGILYLTMELVVGESLETYLDRHGPLDVERAVSVAEDICRGVEAAHAAGVVHRDLKPANVLLEEGGRVVVTDFGIARAFSEHGDASVTVGIVGTPRYMAPEQVAGGAIDARTDIYALGLVLYELLTGEPPFDGSSPVAVAMARLHQAMPDPRARRPVPDDLAALVVECGSRDPEDRPGSIREVLARLVSGLHASATLVSTSVPTTERAQRPAAGSEEPGSKEASSKASPSRVSPSASASATTSVPDRRTLAILPFRYRGPPELDYLADALTEGVIDLLSTTRALKVLARGATDRYRDAYEPEQIGRELGADVLVDSTVTCSADRVRVIARLIDVASGSQIWNERFDTQLDDVLALEDRISRRIAEALRFRITTETYRGDASGDAVQLYLRARRSLLRAHAERVGSPEEAVTLLDRALADAPDFRPAMSLLAVATLRAWFMSAGPDGIAWERRAREAVARAMAEAGEMADTQFAAATLAVQDGDFARAAVCLGRAIAIAPTFAEAHDYIGRLQMEAGPVEHGLARLRVALELDPTLAVSWIDIARYHAMCGDYAAFERAIETVSRATGRRFRPVSLLRLRVAAWRGELREASRSFRKDSAEPMSALIEAYIAVGLGDLSGPAFLEQIDGLLAPFSNPRFGCLVRQLAVESLSIAGYDEEALVMLEMAADGPFIDLLWLDQCPVLASLRDRPEYVEIRRRIEKRAEPLWAL